MSQANIILPIHLFNPYLSMHLIIYTFHFSYVVLAYTIFIENSFNEIIFKIVSLIINLT